MKGYRDAYDAFRWEDTLAALGWDRTGSINLGRTIVDQLPKNGDGEDPAVSAAGARFTFTRRGATWNPMR